MANSRDPIEGRFSHKVYRLISQRLAQGGSPTISEPGPAFQTSPLEKDPEARCMFYRIGLVKTTKDTKTSRERIGKIVREVSALAREEASHVERVFALYASGPGAVCVQVPLCSECALTELCRYFRRRPSIKELPEGERPRERLVAAGEEHLSNAELLGIIIRDGTPESSAVDLAQKLLTKYGDFRTLSTKTIGELCKVKGIGPAKAAQVKAALAIARRYASVPLRSGAQIKSSEDIFKHFHERLRDRRQETFLVILLDSKNKIIKDLQISSGSLSSSLVHPREVFSPAIRESAASVVFVHNHPSGDPAPSTEDVELTQRLREVADVVGIKILDHVIIGAGKYVSLKDKGLL